MNEHIQKAPARVAPSGMFGSPQARAAIRLMSGIANPALKRIAGTRWFSAFGLLLHVGRRSARHYVTPVGVGWNGTAFVIPLTFGENSQWYLNVMAADGCQVRWRGRQTRVGHPQVVAAADAKQSFAPALWLLLRIVGIQNFLQLEPVE